MTVPGSRTSTDENAQVEGRFPVPTKESGNREPEPSRGSGNRGNGSGNRPTITPSTPKGPRPRRHHARWSSADLAQLRTLWEEGYTAEQISPVLGRAVRAVYARLHLLRQEGVPVFQCSRCRQDKPREEFALSMRQPGGYCRACHREHRRAVRPA